MWALLVPCTLQIAFLMWIPEMEMEQERNNSTCGHLSDMVFYMTKKKNSNTLPKHLTWTREVGKIQSSHWQLPSYERITIEKERSKKSWTDNCGSRLFDLIWCLPFLIKGTIYCSVLSSHWSAQLFLNVV